eukprot:comp7702_c0_seq1/m.3338 comp7702_c0_seq1/g.3338  ORF comp7702_c0_seq1/g.3338 comp7702_c0_seq1/m.3338 type:complete len:300 (-) comp7702_c0_seq1:325-1224(-)
MRDRMSELQKVAGSQPLAGPGDAEAIEMDESDAELQDFLKRCEGVKNDIAQIEENIKKVADKHGQALAAINDKQAQQNKQELEDLMAEVTRLGNRVRKELKKMDAENKATPPEDLGKAIPRMKKQQQNTLGRKFGEVMTEYNDTQAKYKQKYRDRVTRQYKIVDPTATDQEVEKAVDDAMENGKNIFQDQILSADHAAAQKALEEIEDRQKDIARLEKSMRELHELFVDLALLVDQQGEMIDRIEFQVSQAADHVEEAHVELVSARKYQTAARKKMIAVIIIVIIILVIVGIILYQQFK